MKKAYFNFNFFLILAFFFMAFSKPANAQLRIAYVEGGHLQKYTQLLDTTAIALDKISLISNARIFLQEGYTSKDLWNWLATKAGGDKLTFVEDAYSSSSWNNDLLIQNVSILKKRIDEKKDIDLILTFGSAAALEVNKQIQNVNILAFALNDPFLIELNQDNTKFTNPYFFSAIEEDHFLNTLAIFKDTIGFKRLGICYEDSPRGRSDIAYNELKNIAQTLDFELIEGKIKRFSNNREENIQARLQCHEEIAPEVEAFYLSNGLGNDYIKYKDLLTPIINQKIPTFTQNGISDVEHGALFSLAASNAEIATFQADVIKQLVDGKSLSQINKFFTPKRTFALNIKMALDINWNLSFELLSSVDRLFREIKNAKK